MQLLKRPKLWIAICLAHLALVTAGASHLPVSALPWVGVPLMHYSDYSGASAGYGFFTPGVYGQLRVFVDVYDKSGKPQTSSVTDGPNREANLRLNDIVEQFMSDFTDKLKFQRAIAASLASSAFARSRETRRVGIRLEQYMALSRVEFLNGKQNKWNQVYSAIFIHKTNFHSANQEPR